MAFPNELIFEIKHVKGKENKIAYALRKSLNQIYVISTSNIKTIINE